MSDQIISKEGYEKLKQEHEELTAVKRKEIALRIQIAKDMGDLSENAEYSDAKDAQSFNEGRISELSTLLKNLTIVDKGCDSDIVCMGSVVSTAINGKEKKFTIVSFNEADPIAGKISNESPLGEALIDQKSGDTVKVETPSGEFEYKILKVE